MASFALKLSFCFIVVVFCFNEFNVEAREGKKLFLSKFTHLDRPNKVAQPPASAPELAQTNGRLGDGPFGPGSGMIPQTKESWPVSSITTDAEFEKLMDTFEEESNNKLPEEFEEEEEEEESSEVDKYNNDSNGYTFTTKNKYNGYDKEEEREGRFMENGKYFYDTRGRTRSYQNGPRRGHDESARGNDHNSNEFETMEEYYKSFEGSQEEYQP